MSDERLSSEDVAARFRWARRQGHPAWLWPEIAVSAWREALIAIEATTRSVLLGTSIPELAGDARAIGLAGYTSGVGPLLGYWLERKMLACPAEIGAELARQLDHNRRRSARMAQATTALISTLAGAGVAVAVLKGAHTSHAYFPDPATRPASDVDLLIAPASAPRAETVLRRLGFVETDRKARESNWRLTGSAETPHTLSFVHADDPWSVDLHVSLDISVGAGAVARFDDAGPRCEAVAEHAQGLRQPLLALHIAAHAGSNLHNLTLLRLVELHYVIRQDTVSGALDWRDFLETGAQIGALGFAWPALRLCERLTPGIIPTDVLGRCSAAAPGAVRRVMESLTPATAQRLHGESLAEHFMWTRGAGGWLGKLAHDLLPATGSARKTLAIYERRAWQMLHRRISR